MNNQTIQIDVAEFTISKKEIKLPYYLTDGICHWYKVINQNQAVQVMWSQHGNQGICIQIVGSSLALQSRCTETTAEDFTEHFYKTLTQLNEVV